MKHHLTLPTSGLSRRSVMGRAVVVCGALVLGSRFGHTLAQEATPSAGPVEFLWETRGDPADPLGNPSHLAVAPDGNIWVADGDNDRFQIFAPDGILLEAWGTSGSGEGQIDFETVGLGGSDEGAIAFAPDGTFYVADVGNHRIQKFGPDRDFLTAWGKYGTDPGQFASALGVAVGGDGTVYVTDEGKRLQAFRVRDLPAAGPVTSTTPVNAAGTPSA
jgi:tripartite motif-containing protein 71